MAEFCQYITKWPDTQDDVVGHCGEPASIKWWHNFLGEDAFMWLCAYHYDCVSDTIEKLGEDNECS